MGPEGGQGAWTQGWPSYIQIFRSTGFLIAPPLSPTNKASLFLADMLLYPWANGRKTSYKAPCSWEVLAGPMWVHKGVHVLILSQTITHIHHMAFRGCLGVAEP